MKCSFRFLLPFLIFYTLTGCVANKRGMVNEHLYTSKGYPDLQIEVDSTFQYIKGGPNQFDHGFRGPYKRRMLFFEHQSMNNLANKVDYYDHPSHWIYFGIPSSTVINDGETILLGETWFFANTFEKMEQGCSLSKNLRRFTNDQNLFLIKYMLWQSDTDCSVWEYSLSLNSEKEKALKNLDLSFQDVASINKYSLENKNATNNISVAKSQESTTENLYLNEIAQKAYDNKEYKTAFSIWSDLAEQDDLEAIYRLATLYEWGEGIDKDMIKATHFYRKASISGHGEAQYKYANKLGTNRKAYFWYNAAAQNPTTESKSRETSKSEIRAYENVANFYLTSNEAILLKKLTEYVSKKNNNVDESLFVGY